MLYAAQAAKQVPTVGGMTRMVTMTNAGNLEWVKSFKVVAVQQFFGGIHHNIQQIMGGLLRETDAESCIKLLGKTLLKDYRKLNKELAKLDNDPNKI